MRGARRRPSIRHFYPTPQSRLYGLSVAGVFFAPATSVTRSPARRGRRSSCAAASRTRRSTPRRRLAARTDGILRHEWWPAQARRTAVVTFGVTVEYALYRIV